MYVSRVALLWCGGRWVFGGGSGGGGGGGEEEVNGGMRSVGVRVDGERGLSAGIMCRFVARHCGNDRSVFVID
jgi:hypothetical protein